MSEPLIGITLDSEEPGGYSRQPWYALRQNYCDAVARAGGLPIPLPHQVELVDAYLDTIAGLVVTGGAFDVDPALFGADSRHDSVKLKSHRTDFEMAITKGAIARDMPILGICGGEQLLAVALGGTLIQHIPDEVANALAHEQPNPRTEPGHTISPVPGTLLARIAGTSAVPVNSAHHQAVKSVPSGVVINSRSSDGVIEGIEMPGRRFCLGVQWHPEYAVSVADQPIFQAFLAACRA